MTKEEAVKLLKQAQYWDYKANESYSKGHDADSDEYEYKQHCYRKEREYAEMASAIKDHIKEHGYDIHDLKNVK